MQKEIKVISGQDIFDIALICYNDASLAYTLISENSNITDIGMDLTGLTLVYTPKEKVKYDAKENAKKVNKVVTTLTNQSVFDLSLQHYGSIDFVYDLIQNNSFLDSVLSDEINGNSLSSIEIKNYVNNYYSKNNIDLGTSIQAVDFLLQENGFYLLQENSGRIIL